MNNMLFKIIHTMTKFSKLVFIIYFHLHTSIKNRIKLELKNTTFILSHSKLFVTQVTKLLLNIILQYKLIANNILYCLNVKLNDEDLDVHSESHS